MYEAGERFGVRWERARRAGVLRRAAPARRCDFSRAALTIEENNAHGDSGGNGGGVIRGSFGIGSSGQSGTSSFSRTNSFR